MRNLALALGQAAKRANADPLGRFRWLPPQVALHTCDAPRKLLRTGNQHYGKTTAGLAELIWRCLGKHPHLHTTPPPVECWVICASWSQSLAIQGKLWHMVPPEAVKKGQRYDPVNGFGAHAPTLQFANGSLIRVKTTQQDAIDLAGATIDAAMFDEPPRSQRLYAEVCKRVQQRGGVVLLTMTPINAPVDWLRAEVERDKIADLHFPLRPEYLIPQGAQSPIRLLDGTICDQAWCDRIRSDAMPHEEPIVIDGEWETRATDRVFRAFRDGGTESHISTATPRGDVRIALGIDHGAGAGREVAILVAVDESREFPEVYVLDEYVSSGETTPEHDARALIAMLQTHGLTWKQVDDCHGDRPYDKATGRKGNLDIEGALMREMGLRRREDLRPRIWSAKRGSDSGAGSKAQSVRWLHLQMLRSGGFYVHPRCKRLIESIKGWDYTDASEWKDAIDALRYALIPWWRGTRRRRGAGPTVVVG